MNLDKMWTLLVLCVLINSSFCEFDGLNKFKRKNTARENYVHPNMLARMISTSKGCVGTECLAMETTALERGQTSHQAENSIIVPLLARRFVNLLLSKAQLKDSDGKTVLLESVSDLSSSELSVSLTLVANPTELKTLSEFGSKKQNLTIQQIDELLSNLFSAKLPPHLYNYCNIWPWEVAWDTILDKVDGIKVLHVGIVLCLLWILMRVINHKASWRMLILGTIVSSVIWEAVRILEEETIKSQSERMRLGELPEHCSGVDNRSWWDRLFADNPENECFKHNYHKDSNPGLRVNYFKAAINLFKPVLDIAIESIRTLCGSFSDQSFLYNWVYQLIMIPSLFIFFALLFAVYFGGSVRFPFFSFGGVHTRPNLGSAVQTLPSENTDEPQIRAPPRRKNGRKKQEDDLPDSSSSSSMVVFNIQSGNFHFRDPTLMKALTEKETSGDSEKEKEEGCTMCRHNSSPTRKKNCMPEEERDLSSEEDSGSTASEKTKPNSEDCNTKVKNNKSDVLAGGDTHVTAEKVFE